MRILMTTDTVGGVWTYTRELATGLLAAGCNLTMVTLGRIPSDDQQAWIESTASRWLGSFRAVATDFRLEWMQDNAQVYSSSCRFMLDCVREFVPDLIHSNQFCYGALPVDIPKLVVAHSDVLSWWRQCRDTEPDDSEWLVNYRSMVQRGLRGTDLLIAPTRWMLDQIEIGYGDLAPGAVIPNGRDISLIPDRPRRMQAVTAGRLWDEGKNIAMLAHVSSPIPILIAGDKCFDGAYAGFLDNASVAQLGHLTEEDLLHLLAESSIYIVTSRYEPFGLAAVEAALCGCAILANDIPPLREVWGDAAIYFDLNSSGSLANLLRQLAAEPAKVRALAARAQNRARKRFTRERMAAEYLGFYRQLLTQESSLHAA